MTPDRFTHPLELWERYKRWLCAPPDLGLTLDISRMRFGDDFFERMDPAMQRALDAMERLESGEIANPDEQRAVGHYWLRDPDRAPDTATAQAIRTMQREVRDFAARLRSGELLSQTGKPFRHVLLAGIGGSALGPQFVADALATPHDPVRIHFFDNTDPDGFDRALARVGGALDEALVIVVSKSGGTAETRNAAAEIAEAFARTNLEFPRAAVAITTEGSRLDAQAQAEGWIETFPMWDWVGGRTSELSAVGLLPAALQGIDIDAMLDGARAMDAATRVRRAEGNPAALLALMWHHAGGGCGEKDMVVLPYKDRLLLFSRYLQQLNMESLGKELDRGGRTVRQGLVVYGNKGSTDQHAFIQQLRDGADNFFVTFIEVLRERDGELIEVEPDTTAGDYLGGFLLGTRRALTESGRESITLTVPEIGPREVGMLIALFERAVGLYAELIDVNAYHQPGVEAGKQAAGRVLTLQRQVLGELAREGSPPRTAEQIAVAVGHPDEAETVFKILEHLAANPGRGVGRIPGATPTEDRFTSP
jgi:glucose-6-phosphate isomerase